MQGAPPIEISVRVDQSTRPAPLIVTVVPPAAPPVLSATREIVGRMESVCAYGLGVAVSVTAGNCAKPYGLTLITGW